MNPGQISSAALRGEKSRQRREKCIDMMVDGAEFDEIAEHLGVGIHWVRKVFTGMRADLGWQAS